MQNLAERNGKAVIPYIVAGDPYLQATVAAMHQLVKEGADIIELGVPFSDPMAEGPVIQRAHERALTHRTSLRKTLGMVEEFRQKDSDTPVVLMGYTNPLEAMGYQSFCEQAAKAGLDGVLIVDLPPEESQPLREILVQHSIDLIFLVAPTTSDRRMQSICDQGSGYIYYVSLKGVTGAGHLDIAEVENNIARIRAHTRLPICVGFGIKDADSASAIAKCADGVVVGSALVNEFAAFFEPEAADPDRYNDKLLAALKQRFAPIANAVPGRRA